ncbi:hypothetical protein ACLOJK_019363 [Asimina triloba]
MLKAGGGGYRDDQYLWRELLVYKLLKGYMAFIGRGDMKLIDNSPNPTSEWKSSGTCAFFTEGGEEERKEGASLKEGTLVNRGGLMAPVAASEGLAELAYEGMISLTLAGSLERFFVVVDGSSLVEPDLSFEGFSGLPKVEGDTSLLCEQVALLKLKEAKLLSKCKAARSEAASFLEGDVQSLAIEKYLFSDVHQRREEFERSHYS